VYAKGEKNKHLRIIRGKTGKERRIQKEENDYEPKSKYSLAT
jgi:hypothetical protein